MEDLTGLLRPHGKGILERVVRVMSIRMRNLDPGFNLSQMADLIKTEVDKEVDSFNCLAYASVVNMKIEGTLGDERTIAVQFSPAVVKRRASSVLPLGRRTHGFGLLDLDRQGHLQVLEYLKPDWVRRGRTEGRKGERGGLELSVIIRHLKPCVCLAVLFRVCPTPFRHFFHKLVSPIHLVLMHTWACF
jgi:hypothetical protein